MTIMKNVFCYSSICDLELVYLISTVLIKIFSDHPTRFCETNKSPKDCKNEFSESPGALFLRASHSLNTLTSTI